MHQAVLDTFDLSEKPYRLNQLRYGLRKPKGHGLIERDVSHYRLSSRGVQVALLFLFFHKPLCGTLATPASIIGRTRNTVQIAGSKPPIAAPTPPSNASSISWLQLNCPGASMTIFDSFCL